MSALAQAYQAEDGERLDMLRVMIQRQDQRQRVYPINRKQARELAMAAAREATTQADDAEKLNELCEFHGVEYPESKFGRHCEVARLTESSWWGRKIRLADWRQFETQQLRLGSVRHFVSDDIARARTWHRKAIAEMLGKIYAIRDDEQAVMSLADLARTTTSNPAIRRLEMLARFKGVAEYRAGQGFTWSFVTITAPSKFHRMRTRKTKHGKPYLKANPKWEGATPRDTQNYLNKVWARIRSALARRGIEYSTLRTVEPHADATPHWHMCFFCRPADLPEVREIMWLHAMAEDATERGAADHRITFKDHDPAKGDMVNQCIAYMIAYVAKNIDGKGCDGVTDDNGGDPRKALELGAADESARRVEAWATLWGIRQFQEVGTGKKVTCYRELRRLRDPMDSEDGERVRAAADAGHYGVFITNAQEVQLSLWAETTRDRITAAAREVGPIREVAVTEELADKAVEGGWLNRWGEPLRRWVLGVRVTKTEALPCLPARVPTQTEEAITTREHTWQIVDSGEIEARAMAKASANYYREVLPLATGASRRGAAIGWREVEEITERALALAPGFFFLRAAKPSALGPVSLTVRGEAVAVSDMPLLDALPESRPPPW